MPSEERMPINERFAYLRRAQKQYLQSTRQEHTQLLDHMQYITGLDRKTLIRHMNSKIERKRRRRQRGKTYGAKVDDALWVISESLDHICAERLTLQLVSMVKPPNLLECAPSTDSAKAPVKATELHGSS